MTAQLSRTTAGPADQTPSEEGAVGRGTQAATGHSAPVPAPALHVQEAPPPAGPALRDFVGGAETRLRDLLAFGMASEGGRPTGPESVLDLRRKAEAELEAHAFRVLHNQVEAIRRQAVDEHLGKVRRGLSFPAAVLANLVALGLGAVLLLVAAGSDVPVLGPVADRIAQFLAQFYAR